MPARALLLPLLALACQAAPPADTGFGTTPNATSTGTTTASADTSSSSSEASTTQPAASTTSSTSDPSTTTTTAIFDLGTTADLGSAGPPGCKGKIDFLFVISRDGGMQFLQQRMIAAVPDFLATIQAKFGDFDYHLMVVDSDADWGLSYCTAECPKPFQECTVDAYPCDLVDTVTACDNTLGAGNVFAAGAQAYNKPCPIADGMRFVNRDQPDLAETFKCMAQLGISGRGWMGEALMMALSTQLTLPGGCNQGFLRKDALLMVTLVTPGLDLEGKPNGSAGTPTEWAQAVVAAKHGDLNSIVMLGILDPECAPGDRLCEMVRMFPNHHIGANTAPDFASAFEVATDLVESACEEFVPPA